MIFFFFLQQRLVYGNRVEEGSQTGPGMQCERPAMLPLMLYASLQLAHSPQCRQLGCGPSVFLSNALVPYLKTALLRWPLYQLPFQLLLILTFKLVIVPLLLHSVWVLEERKTNHNRTSFRIHSQVLLGRL